MPQILQPRQVVLSAVLRSKRRPTIRRCAAIPLIHGQRRALVTMSGTLHGAQAPCITQ